MKPIYRFGLFEANPATRELLRQGTKIRLQEQPFRVLLLLLENHTQVVTRDQLRQQLWSEDTYVEFDSSLRVAVGKLRDALGDSADNPRFVATVPRLGYRFLAPVSVADSAESVATAKPLATASLPIAPDLSARATSLEARLPARPGYRRIWLGFAIAAVVLLATVTTVRVYRTSPAYAIGSSDTVLLADFTNTTGEVVFDDSLRQGLEIGLKQSPSLHILPERKSVVVLEQMGHPSDERITGKTAIDVCRRTGSKVAVQGSISSLGTSYLVGLAAIRCDTGALVAHEEVGANRKEDVIDALGKATARLRAHLGESLASIQKYNAPLEQATTPSLEALNAYSLALSTWDKKGDQASLPLFNKVIELDPNFAMAYGALATIYHNLGETEFARKNAIKSYELRGTATEAEKISIESRYHLYVTGDMEKAAQVYEHAVQAYPGQAGALNHLGITEANLGRYEKAAESMREALRLDPTRANTYAALAQDLLALERPEEAGTVLADAEKQNFRTDVLLQANYWRAFLRKDNAEMQRILQRSPEIAGAHSLLLAEQANTESCYGHFTKARELTREAADSMQQDADPESAAVTWARAAVREAEIGNSANARAYLGQALKQSQSRDIRTLGALVSARTGDLKQAKTLSDELDKEYPSDTFIQKYWLPTIRAEIAIQQGQWPSAIQALNTAASLESASSTALSVAGFYPAHVRGRAYLAAGDGNRASLEFEKIIDHPGMVLNFPIAPLARLGQARAYVVTKDSAKARAAYRQFFDLWKDADPEIPILKDANAEYAKLGSQ
jgi:eukaryotic-like serine/threonine-protein kinase